MKFHAIEYATELKKGCIELTISPDDTENMDREVCRSVYFKTENNEISLIGIQKEMFSNEVVVFTEEAILKIKEHISMLQHIFIQDNYKFIECSNDVPSYYKQEVIHDKNDIVN